MTEEDEQLVRYSVAALQAAAAELGVRPTDLARRLADGEIARMALLLNAALRHVDNSGLRRRIEDTLLSVTDGKMPALSAESELDWALKVAKDRRTRGDEPPPQGS